MPRFIIAFSPTATKTVDTHQWTDLQWDAHFADSKDPRLFIYDYTSETAEAALEYATNVRALIR